MKIMGIDLKRDFDAIILGAVVFVALAVIPFTSRIINKFVLDPLTGLFEGRGN